MHRSVPALLTAAALVLAVGAPAEAKSKSFRDKRGDVASTNDVLRTKVANGRRIGVRIKHVDLRRDVSDVQFKVQSRGSDAEYVVFAAVDGSYAQVIDFNEAPTTRECPGLRVSASVRKDVTKLSVPRTCVGNPSGAVRLSPRVQWSDDGSLGDWSINGNDHFTPYIKR
ncbi:hypothetical protein [Nocardioides sp.]|uniref:hypothetical protein n=1 Tax=Nocardioides sp. TaxID=35761 RepID=UPI002B2668FF|nr:hypothetical protein [Nocardioides sp.]